VRSEKRDRSKADDDERRDRVRLYGIARGGVAHDIDDDGEPERPQADATERVGRVAEAFKGVLEALELDLGDPNLAATHVRVARAYEELFSGLREGGEPTWRSFPNTENYSQMVSVIDVPFFSLCAHHFLPFFGSAHVAYIPGDRIVGLSKLARLVDFYARRPQIQERMTEQIVACLNKRLDPKGAMVVVQARHFCMEMRGVSKPGVLTTTSALSGAFEEDRVRQEFLSLLPSRTSLG
jgi:GTP cyclohydrolase I